MNRLKLIQQSSLLRRLAKIAAAIGIPLAFFSVVELLAPAPILYALTRFQCDRLNDISQFNPSKLSSLSWASFAPPGGTSATMEARTVSGYVLTKTFDCEPGTITNSSYEVFKEQCLREAAQAGGTGSETQGDTTTASDPAPNLQTMSLPSYKRYQSCMANGVDGVGHWSYYLGRNVWDYKFLGKPISDLPLAVLVTIPVSVVVAVADMAFHSLFDLSWATVSNWVCLLLGLWVTVAVVRILKLEADSPPALAFLVLVLGLGPLLVGSYIALGLQWALSGILFVGAKTTTHLAGLAAGASLGIGAFLFRGGISVAEHHVTTSVEHRIENFFEPKHGAGPGKAQGSTTARDVKPE